MSIEVYIAHIMIGRSLDIQIMKYFCIALAQRLKFWFGGAADIRLSFLCLIALIVAQVRWQAVQTIYKIRLRRYLREAMVRQQRARQQGEM